MRPRFSMRLMLIAFVMLAVLLYVLVVRPTSLAARFVSAVSSERYETAEGLLSNPEDWSRIINQPGPSHVDRIYAEMMPREWPDVWKCQRRLIVRVARHQTDQYRHVEWTEDTELIARPLSLNIESPASVPMMVPSQPTIINPGENMYLERNSRTG
jgi:hypothetical protein